MTTRAARGSSSTKTPRPRNAQTPQPGEPGQLPLRRASTRADIEIDIMQALLNAQRSGRGSLSIAELAGQVVAARLVSLDAGLARIAEVRTSLQDVSDNLRRSTAAATAAHLAVQDDDDLRTLAEALERMLSAYSTTTGPWAPAVGPVYRTKQVRALLGGVSRQAISDRVRRRTLLAMRTADGHTVYPAWQFTGRGTLPGLADVLQAFDDDVVDAWTLASWLRTPLEALGGRSVAAVLADPDSPDSPGQAAKVAARTAARWAR